jgi:hypothetical protein
MSRKLSAALLTAAVALSPVPAALIAVPAAAQTEGRYLGDATVNVTGNGKNISVHCQGPWVLMKLPEGSYKVSTNIAGTAHKDVTIGAPGRVVVQF